MRHNRQRHLLGNAVGRSLGEGKTCNAILLYLGVVTVYQPSVPSETPNTQCPPPRAGQDVKAELKKGSRGP